MKKLKCNDNEIVNISIFFVSNFSDFSYYHWLSLPRPVLISICKIIHKNPNLIKRYGNMPVPYKMHLIIKHWGFQRCLDGVIYRCIAVNWIELEPNI